MTFKVTSKGQSKKATASSLSFPEWNIISATKIFSSIYLKSHILNKCYYSSNMQHYWVLSTLEIKPNIYVYNTVLSQPF